jgi:OCT family organic cation transporter-like MFS transporter 4/5
MVLESPRYLLIRHKTKQAHKVFETIAKWNKKDPPTLKMIEELQEEIVNEESSVIHGVKAIRMIGSNHTLRNHMLILIFCNLTCSVVYYGVTFNAKNLSGNPYWNMVYMGLFDMVCQSFKMSFS